MIVLCRAASNQLSTKLCAPVSPAGNWPRVPGHTGSLMVHPGFWVTKIRVTQSESAFLELHDSSLCMQCFWAEGPECAKEGRVN